MGRGSPTVVDRDVVDRAVPVSDTDGWHETGDYFTRRACHCPAVRSLCNMWRGSRRPEPSRQLSTRDPMASIDDLRLETPRLVLRPPRADDLDAWSDMMLDEPTARFIGGVMPRAVCWRALMTMIGAWHSMGFAMFSVIEKESGRWIGRLGPWQPEGWPGPEIGWAIARDCWGKGYAVEGASA